ncbi:MAG: protein translocase subunit SecF [Gemmatimonadetes bacterium]|nr:protein translocase subunit SecF [Gemmatimonadota bacterium]
MLRFFRDPHYPFISWRRYAYAVSLAILVPGLVSLSLKGGPRYGIDFTGGTLVQLRFQGEAPLDRVRATLNGLQLDSYELQRFGEQREIVVRARGEEGTEAALAPRIADALRTTPELRANRFEVVRVEAVGPKIGGELQRKALLAIAYSCILIIGYIYIRFKGLKYGVAAVIALVHDAILTVGLFSILNKDITLDVVAAVLTIIGYSVNDSIVVLDRIRENLRSSARRPFAAIVDAAINQTLSRTVITGVSTLLVVLALFFVGGEVIHDFAFALLVGIVVGTYSSIFVVAPLLVEWERYIDRSGAAPAATTSAPAPQDAASPRSEDAPGRKGGRRLASTGRRRSP